MDDLKSREPGNQQEAEKSSAEIPPPENREHLTEPTWIENMIHMAGVFLGQENPDGDDSSEEKPPKSAAA
jgi:hypothetical protein